MSVCIQVPHYTYHSGVIANYEGIYLSKVMIIYVDGIKRRLKSVILIQNLYPMEIINRFSPENILCNNQELEILTLYIAFLNVYEFHF